MNSDKVTAQGIRAMKSRGEAVGALTAYDYPMTRLLDEAGIPLILVGDSLGMVVLGYENTTLVTLEDMEHHVRAAARAKPRALLAADLPYRSYDSPAQAVVSARRLIAAGAEAVKAEGGRGILEQVRAIIAEGIPYLGHLGMLPQSILLEGRYRIKGHTDLEKEALLEDADALARAGAFGLVLELVKPEVAKAITARVSIPTIGIGSGPDCDGQILVTLDLVGLFPWFTPRFVKPGFNASEPIKTAVKRWHQALGTRNPSGSNPSHR